MSFNPGAEGAGRWEGQEMIAWWDEFDWQMQAMDPEAVIVIRGKDYLAARQDAAEKAREYKLPKTFSGGKIYRQKRVNKSRRVSNRRRRNKSRKTKRIR